MIIYQPRGYYAKWNKPATEGQILAIPIISKRGKQSRMVVSRDLEGEKGNMLFSRYKVSVTQDK